MGKSWLLGLTLATMAFCAAAQVYEWRDPQGRLIYGDMPPVGVEAKLIRGAAARPTADPAAAGSDRAPESGETPQETLARGLAALRDQTCVQARAQLTALESEPRIARLNEQGEREFLTDEQRAEELELMQNFIAENCQ